MNKVFCHVWDYTILIYTNEIQIIFDLYKIGDVGGIPVQFQDKCPYKEDISLYIINSSGKVAFIQEGLNYYLYLNLEDGIRYDSLRNLVGQFVSVVAIINGEYPLHSAAVKVKDKGILLLGGSGAGKTILSIYLCNKINAYWLSNDWSAISLNDSKSDDKHVEITKGYDIISVRKESLAHITPYIASQKTVALLNTCSEEKKIFDLHALNIKKGHLPEKISNIYIISINNNLPYCITQLSYEEVYALLKQELTWVVSGVNSSLYNKKDFKILEKVVVDVIPPNLDNIIAEIYRKVTISKISGNVKAVGQYIRRQV